MAIVQSDVTAFAPELNTKLSDGAWTDILAYVNEIDLTRAPFSGVTADSAQDSRLAQIYLAAHIGTMTWRGSSAAAGPLTGESVGGVRRSYGLLAITGRSALMTTRYGQMYLDILGMSLIHGPLVL